MSEAMPPQPMSYATPGMVPTRTSAAAVTSLVCGILGCFVVTGIAAIITGIIGLRATRDPQVKGRGFAIAGLILGIITTIGGASCFATSGAVLFKANSEANNSLVAVNALTKAAAAGDLNAAMKVVDSTYLTQADIERLIAMLQPLGQPGNYSKTGFSANSNVGSKTRIEVTGGIPYPSGEKAFTFTLETQPDGTHLVVGYKP